MTEEEKLIYRGAVNDARELIIADAEKAQKDGRRSDVIAIAGCSRLISKLLEEF